jgi:hypothetical protein
MHTILKRLILKTNLQTNAPPLHPEHTIFRHIQLFPHKTGESKVKTPNKEIPIKAIPKRQIPKFPIFIRRPQFS